MLICGNTNCKALRQVNMTLFCTVVSTISRYNMESILGVRTCSSPIESDFIQEQMVKNNQAYSYEEIEKLLVVEKDLPYTPIRRKKGGGWTI